MPNAIKGSAEKWPLRFLFALLVVATGVGAMILVGSIVDKAVRGNLTDLAEVAAASIDHTDVNRLTGTTADLQTASYQYLKIGMIRIRQEVQGSRFAYLLGMRDSRVLILVDSEPPESPDYSAPGDVYYEAPAEIARRYPFGKSFAVGPYTDRWGTWVSGYAPIKDPVTGDIHAYVGIDISESVWRSSSAFQQGLVAVATIFALILLFVSFRLRDSRQEFLDMVRSEAKKLRLIFDQLPVGIMLVDANKGMMTYANQKTYELLGQKTIDPNVKSESTAAAFRFLRPNGEPFPFEELPLIKTLQTGAFVEKCQLSFARPDGKRMIVQATSLPIKSNGVMATAVLVFEDVSKEKEIERMKSEFVSTVSHQLRTPATMIRWLTEVMLEDRDATLTRTQKEYLQQIHDGNQRMIALMTDLLDLSRIEAGKGLALTKVSSDFVSVCDALLAELKPQADAKRVRIKKASKFPKRLPGTFDPDKIKQVFQNLLENAVKYSNAGGQVVLDCDTSDPASYIFSVRDAGIGIPASQHSSVFQSFFRASNARAFAQTGTGLGLSIAKAIVENHGGRIWFVSEEGKGTTFFLSLPRN